MAGGCAPGQAIAFGTEVGSLSIDGNAATQDSYPLTDTIEVSVYTDLNGHGQIGDTFYAGSVANGFIGVVSTVPFDEVIITQVPHTTLYDDNGYALEDPYQLTIDNTRFGVAPTLPTVTVTGSDPNAEISPLQDGAFVVTLSAAAATDLQVAYTVKGSATPGTDYKKLPDVVTVPAGATSAKIKVKPKGDLGGGGSKVVKLTLQAGTGYLVGTPDPVKVKIKP